MNFKFQISDSKFGFCVLFVLLIANCFLQTANAQPSPKDVLGFHPTDDKTIADWKQITNYFNKLDAASKRITVKEIGKTTLGKPIITAFISSEINIANLEKYKQINKQLANPRSIKGKKEAELLIANGKTVVAISCSIHSTEIVASQMSMNLAYELATASDTETLEILNNTILMLIPSSNPDGIDIVANWYRKTLGTKFEGTSPPELYHHYAGHDNNRDWFMMNLKETRAITQLFWKEWFPQIVYDVHQQGKIATRFTIPPFFDPPNPRIAPSILREVGLIGYKMAADLQAKNIAGVATNASYDTWWHGGFRSAPYYHNSIGILTEAASADLMSPTKVTEDDLKTFRGTRGLPSLLDNLTNFPHPWRGGIWRPSDIAELEMTASKALLQMSAKFRPRYLRNFYELGNANLAKNIDEPEAFIIPAGQPNGETISRFLEILTQQGIEVFEMTEELHVKTEKNQSEFGEFPLGSFIVLTNQTYKNNVLSLFEKQIYPNRVGANGEPDVPYDVAGWTLPLQMGIETVNVWKINGVHGLKKLENINQARKVLNLDLTTEPFAKFPNPIKNQVKLGLYKGFTSSMDEGWTRLVLDNYQIPYKSITDADFKVNNLPFEAIILPSQSDSEIVNGLRNGTYPDEYSGGITEKGVENLKKFVENGGRLMCFDDSCETVIKRFNLPVKNVLNGLKRSEFYCPGSILNLDIDQANQISKGFGKNAAAYFINSSAFEIADETKVKSIAKFTKQNTLLSGWLLGEKYLNGKTALAEANYGKGKIILFGFRPQHRGQTFGTFPLIFNALER
jgi:Zinc carboxypeptidase